MTAPLRIALIGGGISSLCLAAGLLQHAHLDVQIYESVPSYQDVGAGLALHKNALTAMKLIDPRVVGAYMSAALSMADEVDQEIVTRVELAAGPHKGALVAELGRAKGRKTVARADLLRELVGLVPRERLHFGKRLAGITEVADEVEVRFEDGTSVRADCVVGCDGVHSLTREYVLGAGHEAVKPKNHDGWQIYRTLVPAEKAREVIDDKFTKNVYILCGPRGHVNCMPLHKGKDLSAGVAVRGALLRPGVSRENPPELNVGDFEDYAPEVQGIVKLVARDTSASWSLTEHDPAPTYVRNNICLIGDSAHAALPFAGNGAAQAIEDACVLATLLSRVREKEHIPSALQAYDTVRRPRAEEVTLLAREFGRRYAFVRGDSADEMRKFFGKAAGFTNDVDLVAQNDEALRVFDGLISKQSNPATLKVSAEKGARLEDMISSFPAAVAA